jgi:hypothetical protein
MISSDCHRGGFDTAGCTMSMARHAGIDIGLELKIICQQQKRGDAQLHVTKESAARVEILRLAVQVGKYL